MLVAAPAVNGGVNQDPSAYSIYAIYTAAHEGTFFDQSMYIYPSIPVAPNNHLNLALSLSKHSTYTFNPNFFPITPTWFIAAYNAALDAAYRAGEIDDLEYAISIAIGNDVFYGCLVEQWTNQGGAYASPRINVGNPAHPTPGNSFIEDDSSRALNLEDKLLLPLF
jgi:hypothetical protein